MTAHFRSMKWAYSNDRSYRCQGATIANVRVSELIQVPVFCEVCHVRL